MSHSQLIAAIVEWGDLDDEPSLLVAPSYEDVKRLVMSDINAHDEGLVGGLRMHDGSGQHSWWERNPAPTDAAPLAEIEDWLDAYAGTGNLPIVTYHVINLVPFLDSDMQRWLHLTEPPAPLAPGNSPRSERMEDRLPEGEHEPHDYTPGETTHPMHTDPDCSTCGRPRKRCEAEHSERI